MTTFATLFSGGELAGLGIAAAGLEHAWGIGNGCPPTLMEALYRGMLA